jgi:transposase
MTSSMQATRPSAKYASTVTDFPDPEVPAKAKRRTFTAGYKASILAQLDSCEGRGEIGALLRREGLYSSLISEWRAQRAAGALQGLATAKRGRKARDPLEVENEKLKRENARLQDRLARAETVIDVQSKLSGLLGIDPMTGQRTDGS